MKVEIWSDIRCPFCYLGKCHFEEGLKKFAHHEAMEVIYRSFELAPDIQVNPKDDISS